MKTISYTNLKRKIVKMIPNHIDVSLSEFDNVFIDGIEYIIWGVYRDGQYIWVELEDSTCNYGRYQTPLIDTRKELYPYISEYIDRKITFLYNGKMFTPIRKFRKHEDVIGTEWMGLFGANLDESTIKGFCYKDFRISSSVNVDIYKCENNGKYYVPCNRGLFELTRY